MRIGIVTDNKLIKKLKRNKAHYFPNIGMSSCALRRYDNHYEVLDITGSTDVIDFKHWININSKKKVDLLDGESLLIQQSMHQSMFLVFVDFDSPDKEVRERSQYAVEEMGHVEEQFGKFFAFYYCHNNYWSTKKRLFGITWDTLPSMAFNMLDQTVIPFPEGMDIDRITIGNWMKAIVYKPNMDEIKNKKDHIEFVD